MPLAEPKTLPNSQVKTGLILRFYIQLSSLMNVFLTYYVLMYSELIQKQHG